MSDKKTLLACMHCGNTWLFPVYSSQYLEQEHRPIWPSPLYTQPNNFSLFPILLCAKCGRVVPSRIDGLGVSPDAIKAYQQMIQEISHDG